MSSPAVRLLASRLANQPRFGGPVREQPSGLQGGVLGKEPVFRSPGLNGKGVGAGSGFPPPPSRFPRHGSGYQPKPLRF